MRTLIFCTSYASDDHIWNIRQGLWLQSLRASGIDYDQLLIVDDASPVMPKWAGVEIVSELDAPSPQDLSSDCEVVIYTFKERLGRQDVFIFPGWFRSFAFGILYGADQKFDKIIHVESDAHIISKRLASHINVFEQGWFSLWCKKYEMPEIAIQACAGIEIAKMIEFARQPYSVLSGKLHEELIPFTHIEQDFVGDRYGEEDIDVPRNADFSTQTRLGEQKNYYWWLGKKFKRKLFEASAPFPSGKICGGWSFGESDYQWMVDVESTMLLPALSKRFNSLLHLKIFPCVLKTRLSQRLVVILNGRVLQELQIRRETDVYAQIPEGLMHEDASNRLTFIHPDAFIPCDVDDIPESRNLSLALSYISISAPS